MELEKSNIISKLDETILNFNNLNNDLENFIKKYWKIIPKNIREFIKKEYSDVNQSIIAMMNTQIRLINQEIYRIQSILQYYPDLTKKEIKFNHFTIIILRSFKNMSIKLRYFEYQIQLLEDHLKDIKRDENFRRRIKKKDDSDEYSIDLMDL